YERPRPQPTVLRTRPNLIQLLRLALDPLARVWRRIHEVRIDGQPPRPEHARLHVQRMRNTARTGGDLDFVVFRACLEIDADQHAPAAVVDRVGRPLTAERANGHR